MRAHRYLEAYFWILAFTFGFQLAILVKASIQLTAAERAASQALDVADQALAHADDVAARTPERVFVAPPAEREEPQA